MHYAYITSDSFLLQITSSPSVPLSFLYPRLPPCCFISAPSSSSHLWFVFSFPLEVEEAVVNNAWWYFEQRRKNICSRWRFRDFFSMFSVHKRQLKKKKRLGFVLELLNCVRNLQRTHHQDAQLLVLLYIFGSHSSRDIQQQFHISSQTERLHSGCWIFIQQNGTVR